MRILVSTIPSRRLRLEDGAPDALKWNVALEASIGVETRSSSRRSTSSTAGLTAFRPIFCTWLRAAEIAARVLQSIRAPVREARPS